MNEFDCRIIKFDKWILPKTESIYKFNEKSLAIGYFDLIDVEKVEKCYNPLECYMTQKENKDRSFLNGLSFVDKNNANHSNDLSTQQLLIFTSVDETECIDRAIYDNDKLNEFWDEASLLRFYSLIHIENASDKCSVYRVIKLINDVFNEFSCDNKYNNVCYFSLDYSDIVICTKNITVTDFSKAIFRLNYSSHQKLIRDSFSIINIDHNVFGLVTEDDFKGNDIENVIVEQIIKMGYGSKYIEDTFMAAFNIGVQNYNVFNELTAELEDRGIKLDKYKLLGRHDISLFNEEVNIVWIIALQICLDKYTKINSQKKFNEKNIIFNYESFIRIPFEKEEKYFDVSLCDVNDVIKRETLIYNNAKTRMDNRIGDFIVCANRIESFNLIHLTPIITLKNSILELLKNGFADDFVLCIFESFISFLEYLTERLNEDYSNDKDFDVLFNTYFDNVNALINSAMHSDRQFIQSPSFNPVFFDIPPKLMAYYTAVTNQIYKIIKTDADNNRYSFVFRPSFNTNINIMRYSYDEPAPANRLLAVTMSEKNLYYPYSVIKQLCHEIAHYVGDGNRNREERKNVFVQCLLFVLAYHFLNTHLEKEINDTPIIEWVQKVMKVLAKQSFYTCDPVYSDNLKNLMYQICQYMDSNDNISRYNKILFASFENISEIEIMTLSYDFNIYLRKLNHEIYRGVSKNSTILIAFENLLDIFSEVYADLQMILILDLKIDDYVSMFDEFFEAEIDIRKRDIVYYRVLNIVMFFVFQGKWNVLPKTKNSSRTNQLFEDIKKYVNYFKTIDVFLNIANANYNNNEMCEVIDALKEYGKSNWCGYDYWNFLIQRYLFMTHKSSMLDYKNNKKLEIIEGLRKNVKIFKEFNNSIDVFCNIQKTNDDYADEIYYIENETE